LTNGGPGGHSAQSLEDLARSLILRDDFAQAALTYQRLVVDALRAAHRDQEPQLRLLMGKLVTALGLASFVEQVPVLALLDPDSLLSAGLDVMTLGVLLKGANDAFNSHMDPDHPLTIRHNWELVRHIDEQGRAFAEIELRHWKFQT
jgi:hypothetical protein